MRKLHYLLFASLVLFLSSCSSDDNYVDEAPDTIGDYTYGLFVLNEGNFGGGNTEVSFIDEHFTGASNSIFGAANDGDPLGDTAQSIAIYEDYAFIIVNNSHKVVVVDRHNFEFIDVIEEGIDNPRFMTFVNGKGYLTNWGDADNESDDYVAVIDLETMEVSETILVDFGPEKIVSNDQHVFVAHKGGFSQNNKLSVIDANSNAVTEVLEVGDMPNSLQLVNNDLWVLAEGNPDYAVDGETDGKLVQIDLGSMQINKEFAFEGASPTHLEFDQGKLFYTVSTTNWETQETASNIYTMELDSESLPTESIFSTDRSFYGAAIKDGMYFGGDAKDYASNGSVVIYDLETGEEVYDFTVGISPSGFFFTE